MLGYRLKVTGLHLLASVITLALMIGIFYLGWYRWPNWYLLGADKIVWILVLVDLGLGPLATLVVSNPAKSRKELRRDIALIVAIQVVALGYGVGTLWSGRPLFIAYSLDRVEIVPAAAVDEESLDKARQLNAPFIPNWMSLPQWVWAPLPDNPEEQESIIAKAVFGGPDIVSMPQHFRPLKDAVEVMRERYMPIRALLGDHGMTESDYQAAIAKLGRPESELGVFPVQGRARDGVWIFDRASGAPLVFHPIVVWEMKQQIKQ